MLAFNEDVEYGYIHMYSTEMHVIYSDSVLLQNVVNQFYLHWKSTRVGTDEDKHISEDKI